jgi:hypothetical protein
MWSHDHKLIERRHDEKFVGFTHDEKLVERNHDEQFVL